MARVMARGLGSGGLPWRETMPDTEGSVETTTPMAYSTTMRFVETPVFTRALKRLLHDEPYRRLQIALMLRPEQGALIGTPAQVKILGRLVREEFK